MTLRSRVALAFLVLSACPPPVVERLELDQSELSLAVGATATVEARVFADTTQIGTKGVTWSSSDETVLTVTAVDGTATLHGVAAGSAVVTAQLHSLAASALVTVTAEGRVVRLELSPAGVPVPKGMSLQLHATAINSDNTTQDVTSLATWASQDLALATVSSSGLMDGLSAGVVTILATYAGVSGQLTVTVSGASVVALQVTPSLLTLARGTRGSLHAIATLSDQTTADVSAQAVWSASPSLIATVDALGEVTGHDVGQATVSATLNGVMGSASVRVTGARLTSIDATPTTLSLARGVGAQLTATGRFSDGSLQDLTTQVMWASDAPAIANVSSSGSVTALALGQANVTASLMGFSASVPVTVTAATLQSILISPGAVTLARGVSQVFTARGTFSDTSTADLSTQVTWSSSAPSVASVSNALGSEGRVVAASPGTTTLTATRGNVSASVTLTVTGAALMSLSVMPSSVSLAKGRTQAFTVVGTYTDASTQDVTATAVWSTGDATIATISNAVGREGVLTAVDVGSSTVTATLSGISAQTSVTVTAAELERIDLEPPVISLAKGRTLQVSCVGVYSDGSTSDLTSQAQWSSATPFVATISNAMGSQGLVTAQNVGNATLLASVGTFMAMRGVTVTAAAIDSISLSPSPLSLAKGLTQQLTAIALLSDTTTSNVTAQVSWSSDSSATASVSSAGLVTASNVGSTTVRATLGMVNASLPVSVSPAVLVSIALSPLSPTLPKGVTQALIATGTFSDASTQNVNASVVWSSSTPASATVSNAAGTEGLVTAAQVGTSTVTAQSGLVSASTLVTVVPPVLVSLALSPSNPSRAKGLSVSFTVQGTLTDSTTADYTLLVAWASATPAVATVDATGFSSTLSVGTSSISVTSGAISSSTTLTVTPAQVTSIELVPPSLSLPKGRVANLIARAHFTDGAVTDVSNSVTWASSTPGVATISNALGTQGQLSAVNVGTSTVSATLGANSQSFVLSVTPAVIDSIAVSGRASVGIGAGTRLLATATWSDTTTSDVTTLATWGSGSPAVATVQNALSLTGMVNGVSVGTSLVSATVGAVSGSLTVQVRALNAPYTGRCAPGLVISQVFGGGGNVGAPFRNDFVELHNAGPTARSLNGLSLQYSSAASTSWASNTFPLPNVSVEPGGYFLVQLSNNAASAAPAITPDFTTFLQLDISATAGKMALVSSTVGMPAAACPDPAVVIDFVGYGTTASCAEGTRASAPSNTTSLVRGESACRDANDNSLDFTTTGTVTPRNASTAPTLCRCWVNETDLAEEGAYCNLQFPPTMTATQGTVSAVVYSRVYQAGLTEPAGFDATIQNEVGFGPSGAHPNSTTTWSWWPALPNVQVGNDDEYQGTFIAPAAGSYDYTARTSRDGVNWTTCDLTGAGSNPGLSLEANQLGLLTTTP